MHNAVPTDDSNDPHAGAQNLLLACMQVQPGDDVLLLVEPAGCDYYDDAIGPFLATEIEAIGARPRLLEVSPVGNPDDVPAAVMQAIEAADHTLFLTRMGDQLRFRPLPGAGSKTMCYALDLDFLGSPFATLPYGILAGVHDLLLARLDMASRYTVRCGNGTDLSMALPQPRAARNAGFTVKTFPVMIVPPFPANAAGGTLVLQQALTSTYIHGYDDSIVPLPTPLTLTVDHGIITDFAGDPLLVQRARTQFARVASLFGGPARSLNSWHAGINPTTFFPRPALSDIDRWSGMVFGSPRYTHFHMCGSAPGDICGQLFDATISFDDEIVWDRGDLLFLQRPEILALLQQSGIDASRLRTRRDIGVALPKHES